MDLDIGERAKPCAIVLDERIDSCAIRRLKGQRDSNGLSTVECREYSIQNQPLK